MTLFLKLLALQLASLAAPFVTLFYRKGIWLTPDDTKSPYGQYEPTMRAIYKRMGTFFGDWYWLGIRNTAYGLAYKWKPQHFKNLPNYANCTVYEKRDGNVRTIVVDGYTEKTYFGPFFHIIVGYRLRPIADEHRRVQYMASPTPCRPFNMDARPILSIRFGTKDE